MLILARHTDERIIIGTGADAVVVTVVGVEARTGKCRLGIEAPPWVPVDREEVRARKERDPS